VQGEHTIHVDHSVVGPTCGLLPVGIDSTTLTTRGLRWNLGKILSLIVAVKQGPDVTCADESESGFDGLVSTSNHLVPEHDTVFIRTSRPIWWCMELR
jgi:thiamine pyrophosphokinase